MSAESDYRRQEMRDDPTLIGTTPHSEKLSPLSALVIQFQEIHVPVITGERSLILGNLMPIIRHFEMTPIRINVTDLDTDA